MLTNPSVIHNTYICNGVTAKYLIELGFPLLGLDKKGYYFVKTKPLLAELNKLPLWLKLLNKIL